MERKILFILLLLSCISLDIMSSTLRDGDPLPLNIVPPPPINENGGPHRSPAEYNVYQVGYSLTFDSSLAECTFEILDVDNEVVYTDSIGINGNVELPDYLYGTFILRLYAGDDVYQGELTL